MVLMIVKIKREIGHESMQNSEHFGLLRYIYKKKLGSRSYVRAASRILRIWESI